MRDVELYQQLLGLVAPWTVGRVELSVEGERVDIWAEHAPEERWPCPECGILLPVYDHSEEREWRHLDRVASPRPSCTPVRLVSSAPRTAHSAGEAAVGRSALALHAAL
jgi:hypothetical protein